MRKRSQLEFNPAKAALDSPENEAQAGASVSVTDVFSSTIIPTIGRATLSRAVMSVLDQKITPDDFEVIVVNDSGHALPDADWRHSARVRVINTHRRERSVARNAGAALARGRYLHFLDDDDWLLPGALERMWALAQVTEPVWLYGVSQLVDRESRPLIELHHQLGGNPFVQVMAGEWVPLQASFIDAEAFFEVGGFQTRMSGAEDVDLCRRIALRGSFAGTPAVISCIEMGESGSSTDWSRHSLYSRWAREQIFSEPGVLERFLQSANTSFWWGRIVRVYWTSAVWNAQRGRGFTAVSRALFGLAVLLRAGTHVCSPLFWRAVGTRYTSATFQQGFSSARDATKDLAADIANALGVPRA